METTLTVENAVTWFNAHTVTRTVEGSIVRVCNAAGFEFVTLKSDVGCRMS